MPLAYNANKPLTRRLQQMQAKHKSSVKSNENKAWKPKKNYER